MDDNQQTPVNDDQELANVLAGMNQQAAVPADPAVDETTVIDPPVQGTAPLSTPELQFEETPLSPVVTGDETVEPAVMTDELPAVEAPVAEAPVEETLVTEEAPAVAPEPETIDPIAPVAAMALESSDSPELDSIKRDALEELRPLVDKLDLPPDEKFDTLLLVIRSTDDKTLVDAAFTAAKGIADENKRAQALLDVIKEIDYFSGHGENPAA